MERRAKVGAGVGIAALFAGATKLADDLLARVSGAGARRAAAGLLDDGARGASGARLTPAGSSAQARRARPAGPVLWRPSPLRLAPADVSATSPGPPSVVLELEALERPVVAPLPRVSAEGLVEQARARSALIRDAVERSRADAGEGAVGPVDRGAVDPVGRGAVEP